MTNVKVQMSNEIPKNNDKKRINDKVQTPNVKKILDSERGRVQELRFFVERMEEKMRVNSWASHQRSLQSSFLSGFALAIILSQNFDSLDSFLQIPFHSCPSSHPALQFASLAFHLDFVIGHSFDIWNLTLGISSCL